MTVKPFLVSIFVLITLIQTNGQQSRRFFRKDYTYLNDTEAFYKIQTGHKTWAEAKKRCEMEGATLFYPEDEKEAQAVIAFWNQTQPFYWVYVGISDLLVKEVYQTIDGRPILDVYNKWSPGEPNDADGAEDCVILRREGTLNDDRCDKRYPFICKKTLDSLEWNVDCDTPYYEYVYNADLGRCYKFHNDPRTWDEAVTACHSEQSYLAIINSQAEADYLVQMTEKANKNVLGLTMSGVVYLGFCNKNNMGWDTIKGTLLADSGYTNWGYNQPDGGTNETCGTMFYNGQLNDLACTHRCFYICEHEIGTLTGAIDDRFNDLIQD